MAQQLNDDNGTASLPGAYLNIKVQKSASGLATSGVLAFVGEADAGPDVTLETDLPSAFYGSDQLSDVLLKYGSGPLVEAYRAAIAAASDPDITGAPSAIYLIKTNPSTKASKSLLRSGFAQYGVIADQSYGLNGDLLYTNVVAATTETAPTTGSATYIPSEASSVLALRVNGGAKATLAISANTTPAALVGSIASGSATGLNSLAGVLATGGALRTVLPGASGHLTIAAAGNSITVTYDASWTTTPSVGDTLEILPGSIMGSAGGGGGSGAVSSSGANVGGYVVTAASANSIVATKLSDTGKTGAVVGVVTAPVSVTSTVVAATTDLSVYAPVVVQNATGVDRGLLTGLVGQTVTGTASGSTLKLTLATGQVWNALPQAGDYLLIPTTAPAAMHASGANGGWYSVTAATSGTSAGASTVSLTRLSNGNPASFAATAVAATTDLQCLRPVIDGVGKALEIYDGGGSDTIVNAFYALSTSPVAWISSAAAPVLLTSAAEYSATLNVNRSSDAVQESVTSGGQVALSVGYNGTTGTLTIAGTTLTTTVTGGTGANLSINLNKFNSVGDLANYINAQTGYSCSVGTTLLGQAPVVFAGVSALDAVTLAIASELGSKPGRLKNDAYAFFTNVQAGSNYVQFGLVPAQAAAGLPEVQSNSYLANGVRGATTAAAVLAGIDACERLRCNFVVPLFSQDATADIALGITDSASTYTVDAINAYAKTHAIKMSSFKRRRNRQAIVSKRSSFAQAKLAAQNLASARVAMTFQDFKMVALNGTITQFQPWMGAVLAASMQAAGFYRSILFKGINCSGIVMNDGSFRSSLDTDLESAVNNGLLAAQRDDTGGFRWNTDQTTWGADDSFVYNSIQAIYGADLVALTTAQRMEKAFVGKSLADVSASVALSYLKGIMSELKRSKLIVGDDEAPLGFMNARVEIKGNTMRVSLVIKLATAIVFIPIRFLVEEVSSAA